MKVDRDSIRHVLALFDAEDIPYIKSDNLLKGLMEEEKKTPFEREKGVQKVKKPGEGNDRFRK